MPYVNSRGELVEKKEFDWFSPIAFILGIFTFLGGFFRSLLHLDGDSNFLSFKGSSGNRGSGSGSGFYGGGRGGGGNGKPRIHGFGTGGPPPPPMGGCCGGGSCG